MVKLLIIADDITGALDTGVQFVNYGIMPLLLVQQRVEYEKYKDNIIEVLVIDAETRHMKAEDAYRVVYQLVREAAEAGVKFIYKKTDSGLRGNVGSELSATLQASGQKFLAFLPAFPKMNRVTAGGIHYIDGIPLRSSIYGKDPFNPVPSSYIPDLFADYGVRVQVFEKAAAYDTEVSEATIGVFDADTNEDLARVMDCLKQKGQLSLMAGCAGAAAFLGKEMGLEQSYQTPDYDGESLLVICGSVNPVAKEQMKYAKQHGFAWTTLSLESHLKEGYPETEEGKKWLEGICRDCAENDWFIIETDTENLDGKSTDIEAARDMGLQIAARLGHIAGLILKSGVQKTLMVIGGDTLLGFCKANAYGDIQIVYELNDGMVLSRIEVQKQNFWLISKSGAFGGRELLVNLAKNQKIRRKKVEQEYISNIRTAAAGENL